MGDGLCTDSTGARFDWYRKGSISSVEVCKTACHETTNCMSFTYIRHLQWCDLESSNIVLDPTDSLLGGSSWGYVGSGYTGSGEAVGVEYLWNYKCYKKIVVGGGMNVFINCRI